ncbi:lactonase family protein [Peptostreptococcus sp. D1]|uniref:lactonase family protein n=1 Tax=Peptostreptococcus sp. D1 TaxID=72304 RepID=UPI0008F295EB|nr:lactonase family protein [Peptostreptococcus sp. D1]SFE72573.1 6-phosphogluconolactonase [Peptostreptococcus sp. D1]
MNEIFFLSGYTKNKNRGIHCLKLEKDEAGNLKKEILWTIDEENPSFLTFNREKSIMFSVSSALSGGVVSFVMNKSAIYEKKDYILNLGKSPCHLFYDDERGLLFASNYHLGKVDIIYVCEALDGFGNMQLLDTIDIMGSSVVNPNQDSSRCHMAIRTLDKKYVIVVNLGTDSVYTYKIEWRDKEKRILDIELVSVYKSALGMGPRHIEFNRNGRFAYLLGELNSSIEILKYDSDGGIFTYCDTIKMLPEGFLGDNSGAAIKCSSDGEFLYASNRGHDSIAAYSIMDNSMLNLLDIYKTGGKTPRDFSLSSDGRYLIVGHQDDAVVTIFERNLKTGELKYLESDYVQLSEIVCISR